MKVNKDGPCPQGAHGIVSGLDIKKIQILQCHKYQSRGIHTAMKSQVRE
jgi:hypothetical protein